MFCTTEKFTIGRFFVEKNSIKLDPEYQREGSVWRKSNQQFFLDTLFNRYDVPKLYLHRLPTNGGLHTYALIDGKQRLQCIWDFLGGKIKLDKEEFTFQPSDLTAKKEKPYPEDGNTFADLSEFWQERFKGTTLDVVCIHEAQNSDIEEIFSRLNSGEPLNAAEKRNAFGGSMCALVRKVSQHNFFKSAVKLPDKRYQYRDIAARFLLIEDGVLNGKSQYCDLKKRFLDALVKNNKRMTPGAVKKLDGAVKRQLDALMKVFGKNDPLLSRAGYLQLYYLFLKEMEANYADAKMFSRIKKFLSDFAAERVLSLKRKPEQKTDEKYALLDEFERLMQQGNDESSLRKRVATLRRFFLIANPSIKRRDPKRAFSPEECYAIYILGGKECANCGVSLRNFDEFEADHRDQWAHGGATSLTNAQALCKKCNAEKNGKVA